MVWNACRMTAGQRLIQIPYKHICSRVTVEWSLRFSVAARKAFICLNSKYVSGSRWSTQSDGSAVDGVMVQKAVDHSKMRREISYILYFNGHPAAFSCENERSSFTSQKQRSWEIGWRSHVIGISRKASYADPKSVSESDGGIGRESPEWPGKPSYLGELGLL